MNNKFEHKDILGNPIDEDSMLAVTHRNTLMICSVMKMTDKMIRVVPLGVKYRDTFDPRCDAGYLKYPSQTVVVDGPDVTAYILKGKFR